MRTSFKPLASKKETTWRLREPVITWSKKHPLKQAVPITWTLEKKFFAAAPFEGL